MAAALWMAVPDLHAIEDVPEGGLRWLQGYDGNAPTSGFRVDGRLRIEAPDEPQPVGLVLESGRLEIGPGGELLVRHGPGGSRFLQGDVVNDGLVSLDSVLLFSREGAEWVNRGTIRAAMFMGLGVTGKGARFRQVSGEIHADEPGSRLEFYNQSWFIHEGGKVFGSPAIVASSARIEAAVTEDLRLRFLGPGCRLEGRYPADLSVVVASDDVFGPVDLTLDPEGAIAGTLEVTASAQDSGAVVRCPGSGATLKAEGVFRILPGAGVSEIRGPLTIGGLLSVEGSMRWGASDGGLTNRGRLLVSDEGRLQLSAPLVQASGTLEIDGGSLDAPSGVTVTGGTVVAAGRLSGPITNAAIAVVDQARPARVTGRWVQTASATMRTVARFGPGSSGHALQVAGSLDLGGTLEVVSAGGSHLADGVELRLLQADAVRGWFARLALPPLETGLHWQVVPSEREVRLVVRRSPAPLVIEWLHRDGGDLLRVSGPSGLQQEVVLRVSRDLKQWTPFQRLFPFAGVATVPVPRNPGGEDGPMTVYQAVLGPVGSTTW